MEQLRRATALAEESFTDLVALALVLEPDLDANKIYSLRGDTNKPGIRGLQQDRGAIARAAKSQPSLNSELGAAILIAGLFRQGYSHHWYGYDPLPIDTLLGSASRRSTAARILGTATSIHHRMRTAARWHAKAHWADSPEDAMLALGIAFDALLSESGPSPGRVLGERFALLEPDRKKRPDAYRYFTKELYAARSSVAHGGASSTLSDAGFVRDVASRLRTLFARLDSHVVAAALTSEKDLTELFDRLKWGLVPEPAA